jgi:hypothetical protein
MVHEKWSPQWGGLNPGPLGHESSALPLDHEFLLQRNFFSFFFLKLPVKWSVSLQCARKKNFVRDEVKKATIYSENFMDKKKLRAKNSYHIIADIYATN